MIKEAISKIIKKADLTRKETEEVWLEIMQGEASPSQIASLLTALHMKGETVDEITGAATIMRKFVTRIKSSARVILDTCGTGGDKSHTFNISTISALVVAASGVTIAKHGNRSVTSCCGSADLLEALGVNLNLKPSQLEESLERIGFAFLFAPLLHPAMKYATPVRKEIGIRTIFNILGPLTNPASATHQLLGVYDEGLVETLANVLGNLGLKHALVVRGKDGLDEVSTTASTLVAELKGGEVHKFEIRPEDFGIKRASLEDLRAGTLELNCRVAKDILQGMGGPKRDIVVLNAGCALFAADEAKDIKEGIELAKKSIDSGKAMEKLKQLKAFAH